MSTITREPAEKGRKDTAETKRNYRHEREDLQKK
jgi:hypothetical protein